jgi:HEAT repeat protein
VRRLRNAGQGQRRRWARLLAGSALVSFGLSGCAGFWDDITSREFKLSSMFERPNPLLVLRDSQDGDKRAKALRELHEPKQYGGTDVDQEAVIKIVCTAAGTERQPLCRIAAIETLSHFKDPRAVEGLTTAFYNAGSFPPEQATVIRCKAVAALGTMGNPAAVELLVRVVREPPAEGPEMDKQQSLDVRIAAARALSHFNQYQATEALVRVLQTEKDVALRDCAHESLQVATGKKLPAEAQAWDELLHQQGPNPTAEQPKKLSLIGWFGGN